jgi:intracellular septation protein
MKILFDLFPVILFFVAFKLADIYVATAVAIFATFAQIGWVWFKHRKVDNMLWVSLALIVVFGGMTLVLRDETFIKWKPTVLYWLFAVVLVVSATMFGKNLIRAMLAAQVDAPDHVWTKLNLAWAVFFAAMGGANLFVALSFPTDIWVNFKLFGTMGLMLVFILAQGFWLNRYIAEPTADEPAQPEEQKPGNPG